MKKYFFLLTIVLISCHENSLFKDPPIITNNDNPVNCGNSDILSSDFDTLNGVIYRVITASEEAEYEFELVCNEFTEVRNCKWSDNQAGSVECNGGKCKILETQNESGSISSCIGCYRNGNISHSGACREKNMQN